MVTDAILTGSPVLERVEPKDLVSDLRGGTLTIQDLPREADIRWTIRRKANVAAAVLGGLLAKEAVEKKYKLNPFELQQWTKSLQKNGLFSLRVTRLKSYLQVEEADLEVWHSMSMETEDLPALHVGYRDGYALFGNEQVPISGLYAHYLQVLIRFRGTVVTKEMFWKLAHPSRDLKEPADQKIVDVIVCRLRKDLSRLSEQIAPKAVIKTYWGRGYCLTL